MSLRKKLNRLRPHLQTAPETKREVLQQSHTEIPNLTDWEKEGIHPYFFDGDYCLIRKKEYSLDTMHGNHSFHELIDIVQLWNKSNFSHPLSAKGYEANELFFFDTETTGLGGGTGNTIFLLGYASVKADKLVLHQHILPQPGSEIPLYQSFLENIQYEKLVTYNGKAFDWPVLQTRHTLIREHVPKLPPFGHFDLYHAARRLWKHRLDRLKLSIVEEEILGVKRKDDVPGFLAPMIYFDFVESKRLEGMLKVLEHNEWDILSLVTLYTQISMQLLNEIPNRTVQEVYEVGRWYASLGEASTAEETLLPIIDASSKEGEQAKFLLSMEWKKQKKWQQAISHWKELLQAKDEEIVIKAAIELAKYFEHKEKNLKKALEVVKKAKVLKSVHEKFQADLEKRLARLERKLVNNRESL